MKRKRDEISGYFYKNGKEKKAKSDFRNGMKSTEVKNMCQGWTKRKGKTISIVKHAQNVDIDQMRNRYKMTRIQKEERKEEGERQ